MPSRVVSAVLWPNSERGPWCIDLWWALVGEEPESRWECLGCRVRSFALDEADPFPDPLREVGERPQPFRPSRLRQIPLARIIRRELAGTHELAELAETISERPELWGELRRASTPQPSGRPRLVRDLETVAHVYREAFPFGTPTKAVAEHFNVPRSTAAKWVMKCREAGLLGPTDMFRAGGIKPESKGGTI